ncbi:MAG: hypothetical protein KJ760_14525, partial [Proteobacteria bacterium]|nr:hypothetical protein [Pseudomonadota bacterium]
IRQACEKDESKIIQSWRKAYPLIFSYKYPNRWRWLYKENPFWESKNGKLPIWIAIVDDNVVAWNCAMHVNLEISSRVYPAAYSVSTYTLPEFRKQGLGFLTQQKNQDSNTIFLSVDMSEGNRRIKKKLGGVEGKPFHIYFKITGKLDHEKLFKTLLAVCRKYLGNIWLVKASYIRLGFLKQSVGYLMTLLLKNRQKQKKLSHHTHYVFKSTRKFGAEVDAFWNLCRQNYSFSVCRDSQYLNWKYVLQPDLQYLKYLVYDNDKICGILVYRICKSPESPIGVICECLSISANDGNLIRAMLNFAETDMIKSGAQMYKCGASSRELSNFLEQHGFQKIRTHVPVIYIDSKLRDINYNEVLKGNWLMSIGDHDMDQFFKHEQPIFPDIVKILLNKIPGSK